MQLGFSFCVFRHFGMNQFTIGIGKQGSPAILTKLHRKSFHGSLVIRNAQFTKQIENLDQLPVPAALSMSSNQNLPIRKSARQYRTRSCHCLSDKN